MLATAAVLVAALGVLLFLCGACACSRVHCAVLCCAGLCSAFHVSVSGSDAASFAFVIDGAANPSLNLSRGSNYTFTVDAAGHPFWIMRAPGAFNLSSTFLDDSLTSYGMQRGEFTFSVPDSAPDTLYYVCSHHAGMAGTIFISNGAAVLHACMPQPSTLTVLPLHSCRRLRGACIQQVGDGARYVHCPVSALHSALDPTCARPHHTGALMFFVFAMLLPLGAFAAATGRKRMHYVRMTAPT